MKQLLLMMMAVVLVGCGSPVGEDVDANNSNLAKLGIGMTKAQVLDIMGPPATIEAYKTKSGGTLEFLIYRNKWDGRQGDAQWTPICIIDGKTEGWGRNFYGDTIKIRKEIIRK